MMRTRFLAAVAMLFAIGSLSLAGDPWMTIPGKDGPGKGKNIVLISGDEEYRSEEALPQLGKILANLGFNCTVLFAIDPKDGCIHPNIGNNIPGLDKLATADLAIIFTRFRNLPDDQMKYVVEYLKSGKPVVGMRTATHGFNISGGAYKYLTWTSKEPGYEGGFGRTVLGETWVAHHGAHGKEGTRGITAKGQENHPILKGIEPGSIFGLTDVYTVKLPLPGDSAPLVLGEVTQSLEPNSKPVEGKKNDPMMPVAWTKTYSIDGGPKGRVFTTTMGASEDLQWEGTRRMLVNGCLWALGMEDKIPSKTPVDIVGEFKPTHFRFKKSEEWKPGIKPEDLK